MKIRNSLPEDLDRIMSIYAFAREFMARHGNPRQWGPTQWPPEDLIRNDILEGNSYVCEGNDDRIIGTFFFRFGEDIEPTYREIRDGVWLDAGPYGVVHRIASDGSTKGVGSFCLNWAYERCGHLRIDTHDDNIVMQNLLRKLDFIHCGTIFVHEDHDPRMAYEKSLSLTSEQIHILHTVKGTTHEGKSAPIIDSGDEKGSENPASLSLLHSAIPTNENRITFP